MVVRYISYIVPVTVSIILSSLAVVLVPSGQDSAGKGVFRIYAKQDDEESTEEHIIESLVNAVVVVFYMSILTLAVVLCSRYDCSRCIETITSIYVGVLIFVLGGTFLEAACHAMRQPIDSMTDIVVFFTFLLTVSFLGTIVFLKKQQVPLLLIQSYVLVIAVLLTWQFSHLDKYLIWTLLSVLIFYDCYSVLASSGPLKMLLGSRNKLPPGLVFEFHRVDHTTADDEITSPSPPLSPPSLQAPRSPSPTTANECPVTSETNVFVHLSSDESGTNNVEFGSEGDSDDDTDDSSLCESHSIDITSALSLTAANQRLAIPDSGLVSDSKVSRFSSISFVS